MGRILAAVCVTALAVGTVGAGSAGAAKKSKATVAVATVPGVGTILVDAKGKALYTFTDDGGAAVSCDGDCAAAWPPLTVAAGAKAKAGKGVTKIKATRDGQVTWNALPLYRFTGDTARKQANGDGINSFGGTWSVVKVAGNAGATSTTGANAPPGY